MKNSGHFGPLRLTQHTHKCQGFRNNLCFSSDELLAVIEVKASLWIYLPEMAWRSAFPRNWSLTVKSSSQKPGSLMFDVLPNQQSCVGWNQIIVRTKNWFMLLKLWFSLLLSSLIEKREPWFWVDNHLRLLHLSVFLNKVKKLPKPNFHWWPYLKWEPD